MFFYRSQILKAIRTTPCLVRVWLLALSVLCSGCGQMGPLYLPKDDPAAAQRATIGELFLDWVPGMSKPKQGASAPAAAASAAPAQEASAPAPAAPAQGASAPASAAPAQGASEAARKAPQGKP